MKKFTLVFISLYLTLLLPSTVFAATEPNFPTCAIPAGTLKVQYDSGTHGIAGNSNQFSGSDAVYNLTDDNALQCFCAEDGSGIQTNWWKVPSITDAERRALEAAGWHYEPNGAAWGLANAAYFAKNNNYACKGNGSGVAGASAINASSGSSNGVGQVLGLATTGSMASIVSVLSLGLGFLALGLGIRFIKNS